MIWNVLVITVCVALITLYEWPKLKKNQRKEKMVFVTLTAMGWILAIFLLVYPDMPGPTQLIERLFKPLGQLLEQS